MDANDILSRQIDMLEKTIKYDFQENKRNFDNEIKIINAKLEKLDQTLTDIKDMLDGIRMIDEEKPLPTTEEQIAYFKAKQEEQERLNNSSGGQTQSTLNTSMPSIETIKNNMN
jgi:hypothetical protein